jgi:hypothetical protein
VEDKLFNYKETYLAAEVELKRLIIRAPVCVAVVASGGAYDRQMSIISLVILATSPSGCCSARAFEKLVHDTRHLERLLVSRMRS